MATCDMRTEMEEEEEGRCLSLCLLHVLLRVLGTVLQSPRNLLQTSAV